MQGNAIYRWGIFPLWLLLASSVFFRPIIPLDETRYLSVAWEMWLRGDFLVPYMNGHTYSHKPPLLFWLIQGGWAVFGVNEWWPKLVGPLCALLNLILIRRLAGKLWPDDESAGLKAPWLLIATLLWTLFASSTMFDMLLTCNVLLGMIGLYEVAQGAVWKGWGYFALAVGLGLLAKGPVIFLHLLPTAVLVFLWAKRDSVGLKKWFACLLLAVLAGSVIALLWALPAASAGGEEYADAILWHQTVDRAIDTKIHARPFIWYLPFLPLLLFPWVVWPRLWRCLRLTSVFEDNGLRFCLIWCLLTLLIFSWLPSKQLHYLIPMVPAFALICARVLHHPDAGFNQFLEMVPALIMAMIGLFLAILPRVPGLSSLNWVQAVEPHWGLGVIAVALALAAAVVHFQRLSVVSLATALVASIFIGFIFFFRYTGLQYDLRPAALMIKEFADQNIPVAFVSDYQGQFNFLGRMTRPLTVIGAAQAPDWARQHGDGYLIYIEKRKPEQMAYLQPHREHWLVFRTAPQVLSRY